MDPTNFPDNPKQKITEAKSIGSIAFDSKSIPQQGSVIGKTSRGVFIRSPSKWLVFISSESYRSPLAITLHEKDDSLQKVSNEMLVHISPRGYKFTDADLEIATQNASVWRPQNPDVPPLQAAERQKRLEDTSRRIMHRMSGNGLSSLLPNLIESPSKYPLSTQKLARLETKILEIQKEMNASNRLPNVETVSEFLGYGSGLTPSGDDFVIGFILALNRWKEAISPTSNLKMLNHWLSAKAYEKTTTLSANLIECATLGLADERLINALDWLMAGNARDSHSIDELLSWGNTSGADVYVGFVAAIFPSQKNSV